MSVIGLSALSSAKPVTIPAWAVAPVTELEGCSFRQFVPSPDASPRMGVILDFSDGFSIWAQYSENGHALNEWETAADEYLVGSFMGPLWPALVQKQLGGGAAAYGLIEATGVAGGMLAGLLAGSIERSVGAGRTIALGWGMAGVCTIGIAVSRSLPATTVLEFADAFGIVVAGVASGASMIVSVPKSTRVVCSV